MLFFLQRTIGLTVGLIGGALLIAIISISAIVIYKRYIVKGI